MTRAKTDKLISLGIVVSIILGVFGIFTPSSNAQQRNVFYCGRLNDEPATMMLAGTLSIPVILWRNDKFQQTPQERCEKVSKNFQDEYEVGNYFITSGRKNGYNIVCSTNRAGGECIKLLFILPSNYDPESAIETLRQILDNEISAAFIL